jgi:hypothetical protein
LESGFVPRSDNAEFIVDKETLGQKLPEYFGFTCHSFHRLLHTYYYYCYYCYYCYYYYYYYCY